MLESTNFFPEFDLPSCWGSGPGGCSRTRLHRALEGRPVNRSGNLFYFPSGVPQACSESHVVSIGVLLLDRASGRLRVRREECWKTGIFVVNIFKKKHTGFGADERQYDGLALRIRPLA